MFTKYASSLLQDLSNECMLKAFSCKEEADYKLYQELSDKVELIVRKLGVEDSQGKRSVKYG